MGEDFYLFLTYKGVKNRLKLSDINASLEDLMNSLIETGIYEMPTTCIYSGIPIRYYFAKVKGGQFMVLAPKIGNDIMYLYDYNIKSGDELQIVNEPIA